MVNWRMCKNICVKARLNSKNHKHVSNEMRSRSTRSQCLQAIQRQGGGHQMPRWWGSISSDWHVTMTMYDRWCPGNRWWGSISSEWQVTVYDGWCPGNRWWHDLTSTEWPHCLEDGNYCFHKVDFKRTGRYCLWSLLSQLFTLLLWGVREPSQDPQQHLGLHC